MTPKEGDILAAIKAHPNIPTYVIRNILARNGGYGKSLKTSHILYSCKRLVAAGKITETGMSSNSICWSVANTE
ncbi:hypothetical protein [Roseibium sp. RKSG952]|uniref:hypothetical protein n=1 Tax=Roseibium sp. RKSG952 TaxID=2529384 RepID=UPI0012BD7ED9|nr:hypothetical protein [Roseibium sp. RKSG952]MTH95224.1 hypothetical protein [Roseibium sp. RKSG952]